MQFVPRVASGIERRNVSLKVNSKEGIRGSFTNFQNQGVSRNDDAIFTSVSAILSDTMTAVAAPGLKRLLC